jgi:hypothetical protein
LKSVELCVTIKAVISLSFTKNRKIIQKTSTNKKGGISFDRRYAFHIHKNAHIGNTKSDFKKNFDFRLSGYV